MQEVYYNLNKLENIFDAGKNKIRMELNIKNIIMSKNNAINN
ncbi:hypothetical protein [Spiroplasma poulsonii]|nr:hypothetical protein [Spiroplasma poulsonii]